MLQSMHLASFRQYFPSPRRAPVGTQVSPHIPDRLWEFELARVGVNCTRVAAPQRMLRTCLWIPLGGARPTGPLGLAPRWVWRHESLVPLGCKATSPLVQEPLGPLVH